MCALFFMLVGERIGVNFHDMEKVLRLALVILFSNFIGAIFAQLVVKGKITNSDSGPVEYANVCVDSVYVMSDAQGNFTINVPRGVETPMQVSHISYETVNIAHAEYKSGTVAVVMKPRSNMLPNVAVLGGKSKAKELVVKGMKMPGDVVFSDTTTGMYAYGPVFKVKKNFLVDTIKFTVRECTYSTCLLRVVVYKVNGERFVPVVSKPLYVSCSPLQNGKDLALPIDDRTLLQKGSTYYVALCPVSSTGKGKVAFQAYIHKGYAWNIDKQRTLKLPASMSMVLVGREMY